MQVPRQGCNYTANTAPRRTRKEEMETLHGHGSRKHEAQPTHDSLVRNLNLLWCRVFHRKHLLHRASKSLESQGRPPIDPYRDPFLVLQPRKTTIRQSLLQDCKFARRVEVEVEEVCSHDRNRGINDFCDTLLCYCR